MADWLTRHSDDHLNVVGKIAGLGTICLPTAMQSISAPARFGRAVDGYPDINLTKDGVAGKDID